MRSGAAVAAYPGRPAAGKTGTTDDFADAWLCGYTPDLATAVWVGYPAARVEMRNVHGISVTGGSFPAMIWHDFVARALAGSAPRDFPAPRRPVTWTRFDGQYAFRAAPPSRGHHEDDRGDRAAGQGATGGTSTAAEPVATTGDH